MNIEDYLKSKESEINGILTKLGTKLENTSLFDIDSEQISKFDKMLNKLNDTVDNIK